MPLNERALLRYLYEHDTGEFHVINDLIKKTSRDIDLDELRRRIQFLSSIETIDTEPHHSDTEKTNHIFNLTRVIDGKINTLDNFEIKARISPTGRVRYQQIYAAQDQAERQKIEAEKTVKDKLTNKQQILLLHSLKFFESDFFNSLNETQKGVLVAHIINRDEKNTEDNIRYVKGSKTSETTKKIFTKSNIEAVNKLLERVGLKAHEID
jgi:hypothetical protein